MVQDCPRFDPRLFLLGLHHNPDPWRLAGYQDRGQESVWVLHAGCYDSYVPDTSSSSD